jgi:pheromone shutdown-related protein TraB
MIEDPNVHSLVCGDKEITLIGTAHVSQESSDLVGQVIEEKKPETVCVELCASRYQALTQKQQWENTSIAKVIKEKKAFLLLSNLVLAYFQKKIGKQLGIRPGAEIMKAIESAGQAGAQVHLADREIRITLSRTWKLMGLWAKSKLIAQLITSMGEMGEVKAEDIEALKKKDMLESLLEEIGESFPQIRQVLIDERDQYLACKIRTAPGRNIVAVVGAGHVPGIQRYWEAEVDLAALEQLPPAKWYQGLMRWAIPTLIVAMIFFGFLYGGLHSGAHMLQSWVLWNGLLAGLGALAAFGHPVTVLSAIIGAPIATLHPLISVGMIAALVEAWIKKPMVKDFQDLLEDTASLKGFWKNKVTRILLIFFFSSLGGMIGNMIALPMMWRAFT